MRESSMALYPLVKSKELDAVGCCWPSGLACDAPRYHCGQPRRNKSHDAGPIRRVGRDSCGDALRRLGRVTALVRAVIVLL
jgi:hypothetical protein